MAGAMPGGGVDRKWGNSPFGGDGRCLPFDRAGSSNSNNNRRDVCGFLLAAEMEGTSRSTMDVSHSLSGYQAVGGYTQHADYGHGFGKRAQVHGGVGEPMGLPPPGFFL